MDTLTFLERWSHTVYWLVGVVGWGALIWTCYVICRALLSIAESARSLSARRW